MSKEKKPTAPPDTAMEVQKPVTETGKENKETIPKLQINLNLPTRDLGASVDVVLNLEAGKKPMQANYRTTTSHTEFYGECPIPGDHTVSKTTLARIKADNGSHVIPVKVSWMSGQTSKSSGAIRCPSEKRIKDAYRPGSIMPLVHEMYLARRRITPLIQNIIDTGIKRVLEKKQQEALEGKKSGQSAPSTGTSESDTSSIKVIAQRQPKRERNKPPPCRQGKCTISIRKSDTKNIDETNSKSNVFKPRVSLTYTARVGVLRMNGITEAYNKTKPESDANSGINLPSREQYSMLFLDPKRDIKNFKSMSSSKTTNSSFETVDNDNDNTDRLSNLKGYGKESPPHPFEEVRNILRNFTKVVNDSKNLMDTKSCNDILNDNISDMISSTRSFKRMKSTGAPGYNPLADGSKDSFNKFSDILSNSLTFASKRSSKSFYDDVIMGCSDKIFSGSLKNDLDRSPNISRSNPTVNTPITSVTEEIRGSSNSETLKVSKESGIKLPCDGDLINQMIHLRDMLDTAINGIWKEKNKPQEPAAATEEPQEPPKSETTQSETTQWSFSKEITKTVYKDLYERAKSLKSSAEDVISSHEMFMQRSESTDIVSRSRSSITLGRTLSTTVTDISGVKDKILGCLAELLEVKRYLDSCTSTQNKDLANEILRTQRHEEASVTSDSSCFKKPVIRGSLGGIPVLFTMNTEDRKISPKDKSDPPDAGMPTPCLSLTSTTTSQGSLRNPVHKDEETDVLSEGNMEELPNSTSDNEAMWKGSPLSSDPDRKKYRQPTNSKRRIHIMNKTNIEASSSSEPVGPVDVIKTSVAVDGFRKLPDVASIVRTTDDPKTEEYKEVQYTNELNNSRVTNIIRLQNKLTSPVEDVAVVEDQQSKETTEISSQEQTSIEKHSENGDLSLPYSDEDDDSQHRQVQYSDDYKADSMTGDENLSTGSSMVNLKLALQSIIPPCKSSTKSREDIISDEEYTRNTMHLEPLAVNATNGTLTKLKTSSDDLDGMKYSDEDNILKDNLDYIHEESLHSLPNLIDDNKGAVSQVTSEMSSSSCTSFQSHQQPYMMNWPISSSQSSRRSIAVDNIRNAEVMFYSQDRKLHFEPKSLHMESFPSPTHDLTGQPSSSPSNKNQAVRYIALPSDQGVTYVALPPDQAVTYVTLPPDQNNDVVSYPVISEKGKDDGEYKGVILGGNEAPSLVSQQRGNIPSVTSDNSNPVHEATAQYFPPKNYVLIKEIGSETKNLSPHSSCPTCGRNMQIPEQGTTVFQTQIDLRRLSRLLEEEEEANIGTKEPPVTPPMFEEEPLQINEDSFTLLYKPSATSLPECCSQSENCDQMPVPRIQNKDSSTSGSSSSDDKELLKNENNAPEVYSKKDRNASDSFKRNREEYKQIASENTPEGKAASSKRGRKSYTGDSNPHVLPYSPSVSSLPLDIEFSEEVCEGGAALRTSSKGIEKTSMGDTPPGISNDVSLSSETPKEDTSEKECECKPLNHKINIGFFAKSSLTRSSVPNPEYQVNRANIIHGQKKLTNDTFQHSYSPSTQSSSTETDPKYNQEQATKQKRGFYSLTESDFFINKSFEKAPVDNKRTSNKTKAEMGISKSGMDLKQKLKLNLGYFDGKHRTTVKSENVSSDDENIPYYPSTNSLPPQEVDKNYLVSTKDKSNGQQHGRPTVVSFDFSEKKSHGTRIADNLSCIRETDAKTTSTREENDGSKHRRNTARGSQHTMSSLYTSSDSSATQNFSGSTEHVPKQSRTAVGNKEHCSLPESTTNDKRHQRSEEPSATPQRDEKEEVHRRRRETSTNKDARVRGTNEMKCSKPGLDSSRKQTDKKGSQELHAPADSKHSSRKRAPNEAKIKETQLQLANVLDTDLTYTDKVKQKLSSQNHVHYENKRTKYLKHSPLSQRLVTLTIRSPPDSLDYDMSSWEDHVRVGKDSKKTKEHRGNKHGFKSSHPDSEKNTESLTHTGRSKLTEVTTEDDISTVNAGGRTTSTSQVLWALARVSVFDDGTKTLEVLHALPTPPRHYLLTDLGDVTVVRNEKYKTK